MARIRCVLGPMADCEFREGVWCERTHVEAVIPTDTDRTVICKMRSGWLDLQCRCIASYKELVTKEEGMQLNCVLSDIQRKECVNSAGLGQDMKGKCALDYVSGHRIAGAISCDQYKEKEKEEPAQCDVCSVKEGWYVVGTYSGPGKQAILCAYCYAIYDSLLHGQHRSHGHTKAMDMLKELVERVIINA